MALMRAGVGGIQVMRPPATYAPSACDNGLSKGFRSGAGQWAVHEVTEDEAVYEVVTGYGE